MSSVVALTKKLQKAQRKQKKKLTDRSFQKYFCLLIFAISLLKYIKPRYIAEIFAKSNKTFSALMLISITVKALVTKIIKLSA
jgi:hypothetical protein